MTMQNKIACSLMVLTCAALAACGRSSAPSSQRETPAAAPARVMEGFPAPMVARLAGRGPAPELSARSKDSAKSLLQTAK